MHTVNNSGLAYIASELVRHHKNFDGQELDASDMEALRNSPMVAAYAAEAEDSYANGRGFEIGQYCASSGRPVVCILDDCMFDLLEGERGDTNYRMTAFRRHCMSFWAPERGGTNYRTTTMKTLYKIEDGVVTEVNAAADFDGMTSVLAYTESAEQALVLAAQYDLGLLQYDNVNVDGTVVAALV